MDIMDLESMAAIERDRDYLLPLTEIQQHRRIVRKKPQQRRELSLADKVKLIKCYESSAGSLSFKSMATKFCISKTAALGIIKKKEEHLKLYSMNAGSDRRRGIRQCKSQELNSCMWKWFCVARLKQLPVTGPRLQEKARCFASRLGVSAFKASNGWLESFKRCYNISQLLGRQAATETGSMTSNFDWTSKLPHITLDYDSVDIFACKAVSLYFRALPLKSTLNRVRRQAVLNDDVLRRDECLTLLLCCSAAGEKMTPWVVSAASSTGSSSINEPGHGNLALRVCPDVTLNREMFADYLDSLNDSLRQQCRKAILFVDPLFMDVPEFSNLVTHFFPINLAANSNPIDLGIESFVKAHYRRSFLQSLLVNEPSVTADFSSRTRSNDVLVWLSDAWDSLAPDLVCRCFGDAGFTMRHHVPPSRATETLREELSTLLSILYADDSEVCSTASEYVSFDMLPTVTDCHSEEDWEDQIVADVLLERGSSAESTSTVTSSVAVSSPQELLSVNLETDDESEDDDSEVIDEKLEATALSPSGNLTHFDVVEMVGKLKNFALAKECRLVPHIDNLLRELEIIMAERANMPT